jgi:aminoglycoside phosphotransferase (APT) family kinase protein
VARQVEGWTGRWNLAKIDDLPAMDHLASALARSIPDPQAATLLHNDFKLDNTMVGRDAEVVAVFDWDMATRGDPLVDLGTALAYWAKPDDPTYPIAGERAVTLAPYLGRDEVAEHYAERTRFDLAALDFYVALAYFRIAVIIQQIFVRYHRGQTSDERFADLDRLVPLLAEAGAEAAADL